MKSVIRIVVFTFAFAIAATLGLFSAFPALTARADSGEYILRERDGIVVVCRRGEDETVVVTDIRAGLLRSADREKLRDGLSIENGEALAMALEDLGT